MTKDASHIRVFDDIPSALQWLGLEAEEIARETIA
jgi:hypothetical protein